MCVHVRARACVLEDIRADGCRHCVQMDADTDTMSQPRRASAAHCSNDGYWVPRRRQMRKRARTSASRRCDRARWILSGSTFSSFLNLLRTWRRSSRRLPSHGARNVGAHACTHRHTAEPVATRAARAPVQAWPHRCMLAPHALTWSCLRSHAGTQARKKKRRRTCRANAQAW